MNQENYCQDPLLWADNIHVLNVAMGLLQNSENRKKIKFAYCIRYGWIKNEPRILKLMILGSF